MRFKSKAQRRKFADLLVKGEISPEAYERWNRDTGRADLPERVKPPRKRRKARAEPRKAARKTRTGRKVKSGRKAGSPRKVRRVRS